MFWVVSLDALFILVFGEPLLSLQPHAPINPSSSHLSPPHPLPPFNLKNFLKYQHYFLKLHNHHHTITQSPPYTHTTTTIHSHNHHHTITQSPPYNHTTTTIHSHNHHHHYHHSLSSLSRGKFPFKHLQRQGRSGCFETSKQFYFIYSLLNVFSSIYTTIATTSPQQQNYYNNTTTTIKTLSQQQHHHQHHDNNTITTTP